MASYQSGSAAVEGSTISAAVAVALDGKQGAEEKLALRALHGGRAFGTRLLSMVLLAVLLVGLARLTRAAYFAFHDSFVAPIVLSPDSDLVIPSKLSLARMLAERDALENKIEECRSAIAADDIAKAKLKDLELSVSSGLRWANAISSQTHNASSGVLKALARQRALLAKDIADQESYVAELEGNLASGLIHRTDLLREQGELNRKRIAALQIEREELTSVAQSQQAALTRHALREPQHASEIVPPEMIEQRDHLVRIELELLQLDTDKRSKMRELRSALTQLGQLDELVAEIKARPVFRAVEAKQDVAFVPYTQLDGVHTGGAVYECRLWGFFMCKAVGEVAQVLPGEVATQDPWGAQARGQYALLKLYEPAAAHAKVLRVRPQSAAARAASLPAAATTTPLDRLRRRAAAADQGSGSISRPLSQRKSMDTLSLR